MVTATENPKLWRVEFVVEHSDIAKSGIVCYVYLSELGIRVFYSHHVLYSRPVPKGSWSLGSTAKQELNPALKALIDASLFQEIWSVGRVDGIADFPARPGEPVGGIDLAGL